MHRYLFALLALAAAVGAHGTPISPTIEVSQWRSGLTEINEGWATHAGDEMSWAQPSFDDSTWPQVDIEDIGPAQPGWRWFRKYVRTGPEHPDVRLLLEGGDGTYELYINGQRVNGAGLKSAFAVTRPKERVFKLINDGGDLAIAIRTYVPNIYSAYHLPLFLSVTIGSPTAISYEREALESERLYAAAPSLAINLLLCLAGVGAFALFLYQRDHREYLYLAIYLVLVGLANAAFGAQQSGLLPNSYNLLFADPLANLIFSIAQIEFTYCFAGKRVGRLWRIYEAVLLAHLVLVALCWTGNFSFDWYQIEESILALPVPLVLPVLLWIWYRSGNREAAWLIFPSMLPAGLGLSYELGSLSIYFGWGRFDFLDNPVQFGPYPVVIYNLGTLLFLIAIGIVMFFRFTRVSREQARTAAELDAAREIQQRLVPAALPAVPGFVIETAYFPAQEVGGDFYQVLAQPDCSTLIVVGDVSGKGLKAAMTGALAIGAIRALSAQCLSPAALLASLNQQLLHSQESGFVTCLCARVVSDGELTLANAGHLAPYRNGAELPLESGLPLGITGSAAYSESVFRLDPADGLTLLSDGVLEARNGAGELFGFDRTRTLSIQPAGQIAGAAQAFGQEDDITVLTLRFAPGAALQA